ncbi:uncharacterized protein BCR38DRAFT_486080 [Pseudomassariella vexata]|uniref:Uncharacterized protein n=1 Tax=Pseudomassariella vexata TaxID=1141098 RepID=A0A1Y2DW23_9PEZI|nr:uncharacterized protein BCR38DRAFT_486080 [Pseudomassariella vexata]ORY63336.1 hypothetical protein BCR38DRAFT_486080 [Pseudomassariella vexata]
MVGAPRGLRAFGLPLIFIAITLLIVASQRGVVNGPNYLKGIPDLINKGKPKGDTAVDRRPTNTHPPPKYKPTPAYLAPAVTDPFPLLASSTATPPPIPAYNIPSPGLHRTYGISYVPPLFIGFTRQWPMLLQCVTAYITAGWPPESIIVVENTGVQDSNKNGKLGLQNPFYLNHTTLRKLGVTVVQTPVLLTSSQLQNFFLATAHGRSWPYYFYSHQDVMVFSFEDGADTLKRPGDQDWVFYDAEDEAAVMRPPAAGQMGYRTIYENALREINRTVESKERWGFRWFQDDHLTLVNRAALDAVGGWDNMIPFVGSDCDMNARLAMDGWTTKHRRIGIVNDVSTVLEDLGALYRDPKVKPKFVDPNPVPETPKEGDKVSEEVETEDEGTRDGKSKEGMGEEKPKQEVGDAEVKDKEKPKEDSNDNEKNTTKREDKQAKQDQDQIATVATDVEYFRELLKVADDMGTYKYRNSGLARNSWQASQHGGQGEPYYYPADGFAASFWILAEAGKEVYRQKWGYEGCDLIEGTALLLGDMWRVEGNWEGSGMKGEGR